MPYGSGALIRQTIQHATPWQRYLIGAAMVGGGVVLVLVGHFAGGLLAVAGVLLLGRMVGLGVRRRRETPGPPPEGAPTS